MREYLVVFLVAGAVTYLLTVVAREIALRTNAVAAVRDRDVHAEPIPYLGGLAMLGGLVAAFLVARELPFLAASEVGYPFVFRDAGAVLVAGGLICAVGVLDDLFELDALTKLGGQVLAAGVLVLFGVQYRFFPTANGGQFSLDDSQKTLLTVLVVVATVNAVNFVDGLDGLAAGVVGIGAASFFLFCYQLTVLTDNSRATTAALLGAALAGACAGFLIHNGHPARIFMGDSGSMLIGLVLSASTLTLTGQFSAAELDLGGDATRTLLPVILIVLLPVSILIVPLVDMALAVVRRTRAGRSPFAPDKQHLHHRLLEIGHSHRRAVLLMWLWAALIGFGAVMASLYRGPAMWTSLSVMVVVTLVLTFVVPNAPAPAFLAEDEQGDPEARAEPTL